MGGDDRTNEIEDISIVHAHMVATDWCPHCTDPEGPASQERTLADHCRHNKAGRDCPNAWKVCTSCGAFGTERNFTGPGGA